jgi:cytidyltransferase-like protein
MKKALVVGGSNGIGLAISNKLIQMGYLIYILDKCPPDESLIYKTDCFKYIFCNLLYLDENLLKKLSNDKDIEVLVLTAGFGRVTEFENIHTIEIQNIFQVNTISVIKIIRLFYQRIMGKQRFYSCIMGSIAGIVSSPMFSVYAASKASLYRFTESVNIELEASGTQNRILNICPGSIKGTKFNGGNNNLVDIYPLADEIIAKLFSSEQLFIPKYIEIYSEVINRYQLDSHKFGLESYEYKKNSGRISQNKHICIGYLSGSFDLFHIGHLNLLKRAKQECDYLIVGVHPSGAHKMKELFIPFEERKEIVSSCKYVDEVVEACMEDSDAWSLYHYDKLFVGSDYKGTERFIAYELYFKDKNVEIKYFPYTKTTNSTQLRHALCP